MRLCNKQKQKTKKKKRKERFKPKNKRNGELNQSMYEWKKKKKNKKRTYCCKSRDLQILFLSIDQTGILKLHFRVMRHVSPPPPNTPLILSYPSEISSCNQKAPKRQCTKVMHVRIHDNTWYMYIHTYVRRISFLVRHVRWLDVRI